MFLTRNPGAGIASRRLSLIFAALVLTFAAAFAFTTIAASPADASHHKNSKQAKKKAKKKKKKAKKKQQTHKVMTRNLYLGTDLTPAIEAPGFPEFIAENGQLLRNVDTNDFATRSKGLSDEILSKSPDLIGLQEVALWRTGPTDLQAPLTGDYTASTVHVDFLDQLMDRLNKDGKRYRVVRVQDEFDFEAPADYDDNPATGPLGGEINGRLTMRDAILKKVGAGIQVKSTAGGNFETIYQPVVSGVPINVDRGWVSANVKVGKAPRFRFVNTHLEAFGDPTIREAQAEELVAKGGPMVTEDQPAILVGDLNSDDDTVKGDDRLAYNALKAAGLKDRGTQDPMSSRIKSSILTDNFGAKADFDHYIDHIMTNKKNRVKKLNASVTGRTPANGFWNSDHAGVFSKLRVKPKN